MAVLGPEVRISGPGEDIWLAVLRREVRISGAGEDIWVAVLRRKERRSGAGDGQQLKDGMWKRRKYEKCLALVSLRRNRGSRVQMLSNTMVLTQNGSKMTLSSHGQPSRSDASQMAPPDASQMPPRCLPP